MSTTVTPATPIQNDLTTAAPQTGAAGASSPIAARIAAAREQMERTGVLAPPGSAPAPSGQSKPVNAQPQTVANPETTDSNPDGVSPEASGLTQGADGRWRNPDGTFAQPPVVDMATDGSESDAEGLETAPEPIVVALRGRNETDEPLEIEVSDPEVAERIRQNANDGMRRAEYNRQVKSLEEDRAQLREIAVMLDTSPEAIVEGMAPDRQERILRYLLASNFEQFKPTIEQWWNDDVSRRSAQLDMRDGLRTSRTEAQRAAAGERRAAEIRLAVRELIPPNAADDDARDFYTDALHTLTQVATAQGDIDPLTVPDLLKTRVARYWGQSAPAPSPVAPPANVAVARPVGANAEQIAARAKAHVARTQAAQATRKVAAKVAPQGAGAVPTVANTQPPKGQTIAERVAWAKANLANVFSR
jgi:hypothetical protein